MILTMNVIRWTGALASRRLLGAQADAAALEVIVRWLVRGLGTVSRYSDALIFLFASRALALGLLRNATLATLSQDGAAQLLLDACVLARRRN